MTILLLLAIVVLVIIPSINQKAHNQSVLNAELYPLRKADHMFRVAHTPHDKTSDIVNGICPKCPKETKPNL